MHLTLFIVLSLNPSRSYSPREGASCILDSIYDLIDGLSVTVPVRERVASAKGYNSCNKCLFISYNSQGHYTTVRKRKSSICTIKLRKIAIFLTSPCANRQIPYGFSGDFGGHFQRLAQNATEYKIFSFISVKISISSLNFLLVRVSNKYKGK